MTDSAFSVFNRSRKVNPEASAATFQMANAKLAPSSSNTIETVVEVGIPNELNTSSSTMSVVITAMKMQISS